MHLNDVHIISYGSGSAGDGREAGQKSAESGYMTVEAAFVVPWVVFIIVWIIYLGYFEYNRCLIFQDDYSIATQTASRITTNEDKQNWLNSHIPGQIGSKYMGTSGVECTGEVGITSVKVRSSMRVSHPLTFHAGMIPSGNWCISDEVNADNFSYTKRMRLFRMGMRVIRE